ncbi:MAG: DUF1801 domain-containing protein [Xanthomonadales bacterium]|nr:DUF1801 domain-containing protein [Xanthomonadales bacterium]
MTLYPPTGPTRFSELIEPLPKEIGAIATRLRGIIRKALPDADENVSGGARFGMALYSIGGVNNVICGIQPTADMCKLFFHEWQALKDAGYRLEGSGKHARHVKVRGMDEVDADRLVEMIRLARKASGLSGQDG